MNPFLQRVYTKIQVSIENNFTDNYDEKRFGIPAAGEIILTARQKIKKIIYHNAIAKLILSPLYNEIERSNQKQITLMNEAVSKWDLRDVIKKLETIEVTYGERFNNLFENLADNSSKELLVELIAYYIIGHRFVKLKTNNVYYWKTLSEIENITDYNDFIDPHFLHFKLYKYDLTKLGKDAKLYFTTQGILIDYFLEQYTYKEQGKEIGVLPGETVIDAGGCWGDTAIYFSEKMNASGKVFCFEFSPKNIKIIEQNLELNPQHAKNITIVDRPVWDTSGHDVYYMDNGPGSTISFNKTEKADGITKTISIDDFATEQNLNSVNFIKMDIEGAEMNALKGAINTIKKFKPKLAIAIYHSMDDFVNIPLWILNLNLGYKIYLGHYTIHSEETVIFATAND